MLSVVPGFHDYERLFPQTQLGAIAVFLIFKMTIDDVVLDVSCSLTQKRKEAIYDINKLKKLSKIN